MPVFAPARRAAMALALAAALAQPAAAEEAPGWIEQIITGLIGQVLKDAAPALEDLERDFGALAQSLEPTMRNMADLVDDIGNYAPPERLENGDILIRRRAGAPPPPPLPDLALPEPEEGADAAPKGQISL